MRTSRITREQALDLLRTYNKESFHIQHALTVEGVMRWFAQELGYEDEINYWGISGLLQKSTGTAGKRRRGRRHDPYGMLARVWNMQ